MCMNANMGQEERVIFLCCWLVLLNVLDLLLTVNGIHRGYFEEANPLMAWVIEEFGYGGLTLTKALLVGNGVLCAWAAHDRPWMPATLSFVVWFYFFVVVWNFSLCVMGALS